MDCEYFISGQARKVNVSLVSWKNETRTGDRRENKIGVLDNRPLNTLVSWKEGENGKFDRGHFYTFQSFPPSPGSEIVYGRVTSLIPRFTFSKVEKQNVF